MATHKECKVGEMFVGNTYTRELPSHLHDLETARLGNQAYDIHGEKLSDIWRPIIIHESDADKYDRVMCERFRRASLGLPQD